MKRRTLDIMFSVGGLALAGLLIVMGLVLTSNANFARNYTEDQLSAQNISFKAADKLTAEEQQAACLVEYAGQRLRTGAQAECYANEYIGLHVKNTAEGRTYASQGDFVNGLKAQLAAAQKVTPPDQAAIADLNTKITAANAARETLFKGETLRGLLLTSYGFSVFGTKGGQAANVAYGVGALMLLLSIAGLVHAYRTPRTKTFAAPEPALSNSQPVLVNA
ncbi:MAG TPA: hypothetical protein VFS16_19235 [Acidimicrobiia bacterium]|nr:hypothetical protein [Acidimicrobiia bacterium]